MQFPNTEIILKATSSFAHKMKDGNTEEIEDGALTVRIVGEFSAGKTRVLSELFPLQIPEALKPISSQEAQTKLPLEISYGEVPSLALVQRSSDLDEVQHVRSLDAFPDRQSVSQYDPQEYRLRLLINESRFILKDGDGYSEDNTPKKLFLIDTPGWNSGEDAIAEVDAKDYLFGEHNLAIMYVCHANRLDGHINNKKLKNFLGALIDADFYSTNSRLYIVITHCEDASKTRLIEKMSERVYDIWKNELFGNLDHLVLKVVAVDFPSMNDRELQDFREDVWNYLLTEVGYESFEVQKTYSQQILGWDESLDIRVLVKEQVFSLQKIIQIVDLTRVNEEFIHGMNMTRLRGLSEEKMQTRLTDTFLKQIDCSNFEEAMKLPKLVKIDGDHPLAELWNNYFAKNITLINTIYLDLIESIKFIISNINTQNVDLQEYLNQSLLVKYLHVKFTLHNSSFMLCINTIDKNMMKLPLDKFIATLFKLSLIQSRFRDFHENSITSSMRA